jgi:hypothetical protein
MTDFKKMTDFAEWLKPEDVRKKMALAYLEGWTLQQISELFNYPIFTVRYMLRDYMPTQEQVNEFKHKFVKKQIKKLGGKL